MAAASTWQRVAWHIMAWRNSWRRWHRVKWHRRHGAQHHRHGIASSIAAQRIIARIALSRSSSARSSSQAASRRRASARSSRYRHRGGIIAQRIGSISLIMALMALAYHQHQQRHVYHQRSIISSIAASRNKMAASSWRRVSISGISMAIAARNRHQHGSVMSARSYGIMAALIAPLSSAQQHHGAIAKSAAARRSRHGMASSAASAAAACNRRK